MAGGKTNRATADGRDRLSNLPDCLLHVILSRLGSRQAVQTCVLSQRWSHLWCAVTCIDIDSADFSTKERGHQVCPRAKEEALARLEDFADNLLLCRGLEPPLDAVLLRVHGADPCRGHQYGQVGSPRPEAVTGGARRVRRRWLPDQPGFPLVPRSLSPAGALAASSGFASITKH
ncbi:hypothetical protein ACQ4PT_067561 [Festuca glaucescens]